MAQERLELVIQALDEATRAMVGIADKIDTIGKEGKQSGAEVSAGFSQAGVSAIELNQALELVGKGFSLIKGAVSLLGQALTLPLQGFKELVTLGPDLVDTYDKQFQAVTKLESILKATGSFTQTASQEWQDFASSLQNVTRVGDEELLPLIGRLGAFTGFNDQLKDATRAALDLSSAFGLSLESSFGKFIKAAQSGTLELAEGVSVQLQATDAAGRLAEAVEVVNSKFAGTAEAIAKGGSGPLVQLEKARGDFIEALQKQLAENKVLNEFINSVKEGFVALTSFISENEDTIQKNLDVIAAQGIQTIIDAATVSASIIGDVFQGIIGLLEKLGIVETIEEAQGRLEQINAIIDKLSGQIQGIQAGQQVLVPSNRNLSGLRQLGEGDIPEIDALIRKRREEATEIENDIARRQRIGNLSDTVSDLLEKISAKLEPIADDYEKNVQQIIDSQTEAADAATSASAAQADAADGAATATRAATLPIGDLSTKTINLATGFRDLEERLKEFPKTLNPGPQEAPSSFTGGGGSLTFPKPGDVEKLGELLRQVEFTQQAAGEAVEDLGKTAAEASQSASDATRDAAADTSQAADSVKQAATQGAEATTAAAEAGKTAAVDLTNSAGTIQTTAEAARDAHIVATDAFGVEIDAFGTEVGTFGSASEQLAEGAGQQVEAAGAMASSAADLHKSSEALVAAANHLGGLLGGDFESVSLQHGAIVRQPVRAIVGDAVNAPEAVIPLNSGGVQVLADAMRQAIRQAGGFQQQGGGGPTNINLSGVSLSELLAVLGGQIDRRQSRGLRTRSLLGV